MNTTIRISPALQEYVNVPSSVEVQGDTISQCMDDLILKYPAIRACLFERNDLLRVLISINNVEILSVDKKMDMDRILDMDDEIYILAIVAGG